MAGRTRWWILRLCGIGGGARRCRCIVGLTGRCFRLPLRRWRGYRFGCGRVCLGARRGWAIRLVRCYGRSGRVGWWFEGRVGRSGSSRLCRLLRCTTGGSMSLSSSVPKAYLDWVPLHLVYPLYGPGRTERTVYQQSDWTAMEVVASTAAQRREWFKVLTASRPDDVVSLLADFLSSLLAERSEASLRVLVRYLDSRDVRVRQYSAHALCYFDPAVRQRVEPGREPLRGGVR